MLSSRCKRAVEVELGRLKSWRVAFMMMTSRASKSVLRMAEG